MLIFLYKVIKILWTAFSRTLFFFCFLQTNNFYSVVHCFYIFNLKKCIEKQFCWWPDTSKRRWNMNESLCDQERASSRKDSMYVEHPRFYEVLWISGQFFGICCFYLGIEVLDWGLGLSNWCRCLCPPFSVNGFWQVRACW